MRPHLARTASRIVLAATGATVFASCYWGMSAEKYAPARSPSGLTATFTGRSASWSAELIAVGDTGVIIRETPHSKLLFLPYSRVVIVKFAEPDAKLSFGPGAPDAGVRGRIRLLSRYPQGASADVLAVLLKASGQSSVEFVQ